MKSFIQLKSHFTVSRLIEFSLHHICLIAQSNSDISQNMLFLVAFCLLSYLSFSNSLIIDCHYDNELFFDDLKVAYTCTVKKLLISSETERNITEIRGEHILVPGSTKKDIKQLYIIKQNMTHFPRTFTDFFENIVAIHAGNNHLQYLDRFDLKPFSKLRFLYLYKNSIEFLQSDLFQDNDHLEYVSLHSNRLKHIGSKMLAPLKALRTAYFNKNICIDQQAVHSEYDVAELRLEIAQKCSDITDEDLYLNLKDNQSKLDQIEKKIDLLSEIVKAFTNIKKENNNSKPKLII